MLGELESGNDIVVSDLEAGVGTLLRMHPGHADVVLVVSEPSAKSIEVAKRAVAVASERAAVVVVANRVRGDDDVAAVTQAAHGHELFVVPEDPYIADADRRGVAPIDAAPDAPGVRAIATLGERLLLRSERS